jgi:cytochrome c oxidase cbb3-type subunit 2
MNNFRTVFLGFLLTFASAWVGLAMLPSHYFSTLQFEHDPVTGTELPPPLDAQAQRGAQVYLANGCVYCHSQQVRPADAGSDIARGWGQRRTVARDYLRDQVAVMGTMRTGPDLSNIGLRNPSDSWHLLHLYNPQLTSPGSTMPPFRFLFHKAKAGPQPRADALALPPEESTPGYEAIPSEEARALVAYLKSLRRSAYSLPEAPLPEN